MSRLSWRGARTGQSSERCSACGVLVPGSDGAAWAVWPGPVVVLLVQLLGLGSLRPVAPGLNAAVLCVAAYPCKVLCLVGAQLMQCGSRYSNPNRSTYTDGSLAEAAMHGICSGTSAAAAGIGLVMDFPVSTLESGRVQRLKLCK